MTETGGTPERGAGPQWRHGAAAPLAGSPAVVGSSAPASTTQFTVAPPTSYSLGFGPSRATASTMGADGSNLRYARNAVSPLPFAAVALAAGAAAWIAYVRVQPGPGESGKLASGWWYNTSQLVVPWDFLPWDNFQGHVTSSTAEWVSTSLFAIAILATIGWIARIGQNVRAGGLPFGVSMPLLAFPAWWILPFTIGSRNLSNRTFLDNLSRFSLCLAILLAQFVLIRWPGLNRTWRAGRLRWDYLSMGLWLPMAVPWFMLFGSFTFSLASTGEDGTFADSNWLPTHNMEVWATWTSRACSIGVVVLLIVVSVLQDRGIRQDRADDLTQRTR
jgi:hypothetical protein